jgi:putative transposase
MRTNGVPFASRSAFFGLSKLSVWWLRLGIRIERIKPGRPQQNGRHERMHLTLKKEATRPAGRNFLQQQARFDRFMQCFNFERPPQALNIGRRKINLSRVFAGQKVGVKEVSEKIWLVTFMHYDLGFFDQECGRVECAENPFGAKLSPMSPAPCVRVVVASRPYYQSFPG